MAKTKKLVQITPHLLVRKDIYDIVDDAARKLTDMLTHKPSRPAMRAGLRLALLEQYGEWLDRL